MDFIFELFMEILVEGFMEGFVALVEPLLPKKSFTPKIREVIHVCLILIAVSIAFGTFVGICLLLESGGKRSLGWWLTGIGAVYLILGISLAIWAEVKKEKQGPEL